MSPPDAEYTIPRGDQPSDLGELMETTAKYGLGSSATAVIVSLWTWSDDNGRVCTSVESIAQRAHVSVRVTLAALARLERAGVIKRPVPVLRAP